MRRHQLWAFDSSARGATVKARERADPKSISATAWDWRLHKLQKMNMPVFKSRCGDTAPVGEVEKISSTDIGAEIHGGGAPGSKVSKRAAAVGKGGDIEAGRGGR